MGFFVGRNGGGGAEESGDSGAGAVGGVGKRASSRGAAMLRLKAGATGEAIPRSPSSQPSASDLKAAVPADGSELKMVLSHRDWHSKFRYKEECCILHQCDCPTGHCPPLEIQHAIMYNSYLYKYYMMKISQIISNNIYNNNPITSSLDLLPKANNNETSFTS